MEIHIEGQQTQVDTNLRDVITERLEALNTPHQDIFHARVTLVKQWSWMLKQDIGDRKPPELPRIVCMPLSRDAERSV